MQFDDVWVAGTGGVLGELAPIERALSAGDYDRRAAESSSMVSYSVANAAPPEMAVQAGRAAVAEAGAVDVEADAGTLLIHSHTHFQGIDVWPAECWIAGELLGERLSGIPLSVGAASNGSLASLGVAASMLSANPSMPTALITAADRFGPPVDRWKLSPGMVFGDGAAAAVLARGAGRLRLDSVVSETDTSLEGLSRGDEPFRIVPTLEVDTARRTREFLARGRLTLRDIRDRSADGVRTAVRRALDEAGCALGEMDWVIPPFVGRTLLRDSFLRPLGLEAPRTLATLGLTIGHLGPADHLFALNHLVAQDLLAPGERLLLIGTGMGFTFSAAVLTVGTAGWDTRRPTCTS
jgi:3-oxoacyl-[acyl-carrier-protein] synthase-3